MPLVTCAWLIRTDTAQSLSGKWHERRLIGRKHLTPMKTVRAQLRSVQDNARLIVNSFISEYEKTPIRLKVREGAMWWAKAINMINAESGGILSNSETSVFMQIIDAFIVYALLTCASQVMCPCPWPCYPATGSQWRTSPPPKSFWCSSCVQFLYCFVVGSFPFNSFLSGFFCSLGFFVLMGKLFQTAQPHGRRHSSLWLHY